MNYDIIGDIHGHADALKALLQDMGYRDSGCAWRKADHQAIFVGDFIDRGPKQIETVDIVRRMVDAGSAHAVMGNHEFNAIAWYLKHPKQARRHLRTHTGKVGRKNLTQHRAFLEAVRGIPGKQKEIVEWFLTLPLWLDLPDIRVVHACWHPGFMAYLKPKLAPENRLTTEMMVLACREPKREIEKDNAEPSVFKAVEVLTKGIETPLPKPHTFIDKDGHKRSRVRVHWWDLNADTYKKTAILEEKEREQLPDAPIPPSVLIGDGEGKPIFIGHYWWTGRPKPLSGKVACVDYSVARKGKLVAYRWDGNPALDMDNFHWIR